MNTITDSEILKCAVLGAETMLSNSIKLKERMAKTGIADKNLDKLIKAYQNKLDELKDMLLIATSVEDFRAMPKDKQTTELSGLLCSINS